jgi:MoaA/NifB/PqqE/SkfB family radical SAM enzyme
VVEATDQGYRGDTLNLKAELRAQVDEEGRLVLPPEVASRYGLVPGAQVRLDEGANGLHLRRPVTQLAKVYVEPTNQCNLECRICVRNVWDEPLGQMADVTFARLIEGLRAIAAPPTVFFGGFGEPLAHPHIVEMVAQAKALGGPVELITNGTLLTEHLSRQLIAAGLDVLWVSLDGATPESYADVRLGAALPEVLANVTHFRDAREPSHRPTPEIGIAFVAMKRNIADLPAMLRLGGRLGATRLLVSNVLPHTSEMRAEVLYSRALSDIAYLSSLWVPHLSLPKMDLDEITGEPLYRAMRGGWNVSLAGNNLGEANDRCPFIESGATAIAWDGGLSPCPQLLHSHVSYLDERERFSRRYVIGNVAERDLSDLWNAPGYVAFRERVQTFELSPCTFCGGCYLSEANEEDCFGNVFPTCGGCLWAQGIIQCP